jgi:hypothetical protein
VCFAFQVFRDESISVLCIKLVFYLDAEHAACLICASASVVSCILTGLPRFNVLYSYLATTIYFTKTPDFVEKNEGKFPHAKLQLLGAPF